MTWPLSSFLMHMYCLNGLSGITKTGHEQVVSELISRGADVNMFCRRDGLTALHCAACFSHISVLCKLIEAGANINAAFDPFLHTPLHIAGT